MTQVDRIRLPLDRGQDRGEQLGHLGRSQQGTRLGRFLRHDHQAPEMHCGVLEADGPGLDDAALKPADLGALYRGQPMGPSFIQEHEDENGYPSLCQRR